MEPWLDKHFRSPVTDWVGLLVLEPWLEKCSRSPVTAWVELLVLKSLVGQMLWKPLVD